MNGRYLLDTSILIPILRNEPGLEERLPEQAEAFLSSIALGELYLGALRSSRVEQNLEQVDELAAGSSILSPDREAARHYADFRSWLASRGRPIPDNDLWIAATARRHELTLVHRDGHFDELGEIDELKTDRW